MGAFELNHFSIDDSMKVLTKKYRKNKKKIKRVFLAAKIEHEQNVILLCKARVDPSLRISPLEESSKQLAPSLLLAASSPIH